MIVDQQWSLTIINPTPLHLNIAVPFAEVLLLLSLRGFFDQNKNCTTFQITVINILEIMQSCGIRWSCITTNQPNMNTSLSLLARTWDSFSHLPVLSSHDDVWLHLFWRCRLVRCFLRQSCWRNQASGGKETGRDCWDSELGDWDSEGGRGRKWTHKGYFALSGVITDHAEPRKKRKKSCSKLFR